ncbi:fimbria/pilus outer membrane usher protein [Novosphingobium sp.]|uniref:fimbria/pilus outer membrane usher protein n=1 Tax=Novosphingobium sp. TaxID=1874826 RepID=UPI003D12470B
MAVTSRNRWCWAPLIAEASLCLAAHPARADSDADRPEALPVTASPAPVTADVAVLALTVTLNGQDRGIVELRESLGRLWIARGTLRTIGVVPPPGGSDLVPLDSVPGALVAYHAGEQSLDLTVPVTELDAPLTRLNFGEVTNPPVQKTLGAVLNYDTQTSFDRYGVALRGLIDFRAFAGTINFESTQGIDAVSNRADQPHTVEAMRFDTTLTVSMPGRRLSLRIGDTVTSSVAWSRPTRLGGVQIGTDFGLQPYFITVPIPAFYGSATLPSTADVYVDGMRRFSGSVPPGPYQIGVGPTRIDGAGSAQLVLTNSLGQISAITMPVYETPLVLRQGLDDWSLEGGFIRRKYGLSSFSYWQTPAASASWRRGLTDRMTISAHGEASGGFAHAGVANVGVGGVLVLGQAGVVAASYAQSWTGAGSGRMLAIGYTLTAHRFHVAASVQRTFGPFADLASVQGDTLAKGDRQGQGQTPGNAVPRAADLFQAGWSSHRFGNIGANLVRLQIAGQANASYGGLFWSRSLGQRLSLYIAANRNFSRRGDRNAFLTFSFTPGARTHVSVDASAAQGGASVDATVQRPPDLAGGFGWRAGALWDDTDKGGAAEAEWLGSAGDARLGAVHRAGQTEGYFAYSGSIALMDGAVFAGRRINNSFAVVSTEGLAHVPVTFQHRLIGTTDGNGRLLVADLNAYQHNPLGIDPTNLPDGYQVETIDRDAVPAANAGVAVHFAIRQFSGLTMTVVRPSGEAVATGTPAIVAGGPALTIGFDGQLYIEDPPPGARITAQTADRPCHFTLPATIPRGDITRLGTVVCQGGV